ncbi:hypothetical protein J7E63_25450 [Bacillus sp. ISL-75]|nr:hypothetical protein [Bacillus sp. ISL-75]MBT2730204.1 hypothetical protein [Bacillus sp. ISL-75]
MAAIAELRETHHSSPAGRSSTNRPGIALPAGNVSVDCLCFGTDFWFS